MMLASFYVMKCLGCGRVFLSLQLNKYINQNKHVQSLLYLVQISFFVHKNATLKKLLFFHQLKPSSPPTLNTPKLTAKCKAT